MSISTFLSLRPCESNFPGFRSLRICADLQDFCRYVQICRIFADLCRYVQIRRKMTLSETHEKPNSDVKRIIKMFKTREKSHLCQNDETFFCSNLYRSIKILQICMDLQDSVQRSLQNPAEKSCRSAQLRKDRKPGLCLTVIRDL